MELLKQFQGFIGSIGFGFFFYMIFHVNYRMFKKTSVFIKFPLFLVVFLIFTILYFAFLVKYTYGVLNLFYPLSIFVGVCFYHLYYFVPFDNYYLDLKKKIDKSIELKTKKLFGIIISKKKEKKHVKINKS